MTANAEVVPVEQPHGVVAVRAELTVAEMIAQVGKIQEVMKAVMHDGEHFGTIPGTPKPTLLKAGAEKLCLLFRLDPQYESFEMYGEGGHLTVKSKCNLYHIATGERRGSGEGSCSTRETKYAYRQGKRACPNCGVETIFKSKHPPKGRPSDPPGWFCWASKGGCGAEFDHDERKITEQSTERVANPDLPDLYNTVLKMANKRSLVAAVLNATAASDIFTQDLEDQDRGEPAPAQTRPASKPAAAPKAPAPAKPSDPDASRREKPADIKDGFDADAPIGREQKQSLWRAVKERAAELDVEPNSLLSLVLKSLGKAKSDDLKMSDMARFMTHVLAYPDEPESLTETLERDEMPES